MFRKRLPAVAHWAAAAAILCFAAVAWGAGAPKHDKSKDKNKDDDPLRVELEGKTPQQRVDYLQGLIDSGKATKEVYFHLGNSKYEAQDLAGAADAFEQAVAMDSTFFKALVNLGLMQDEERLFPKAIETFEQASRLQPDNPDVWSHMGNTYYAQNDIAKAVELYRTALKLQPDAAHALYSMGVAFADAGMFREAVQYWERVAMLDRQGDLGKNAKENLDLVKKYLIP